MTDPSTPQEGEATNVPNKLPALYGHCVEVFTEMLNQSEVRDGIGQVYEGHLTKLVMTDLRLSTPLYTSVTNKLQAMGCMEQLKRGGGGSASQWVLHYPPTEDLFLRTDDVPRTKKASKKDQENQRYKDLLNLIRDLERRVIILEAQQGA